MEKKPLKNGQPMSARIAGGEREKSPLHAAAQAAHLPDVLLVVQRVDDRAGAKEEQRLEKRVREQMKHGRAGRRQADRHDHVAQLRERGVGEDALDVVLLRGHQRGEERSDDAHPRRSPSARPRDGSMRKETRASMYTPAATIVAAWMSAETGVGPSMASGSQTCSGNCADLPTAPQKISSTVMVRNAGGETQRRQAWSAISLKTSGAAGAPDHQDAEHEAEVADAIGDESLVRRVRRGSRA